MRLMRTRWLLAALSFGFGAKLMVAALKIEGFGAAGYLIFSFSSFIGGVLLISPETVFRIAEWCSRPITDLIFPSEEFSKPPLSYVLARRYSTSLRLEESLLEYEKIIHFYPNEKDAYIELVGVTRRLGDDRTRRKYAALFRKRFNRKVPEVLEIPQAEPVERESA
jgi:hypothetical protein